MRAQLALSLKTLAIYTPLFVAGLWYLNLQAAAPVSETAQAQIASVQTQSDRTKNITFTQGEPSHLAIPRLNIDLLVADGDYNTQSQEWDLTKDKAHFATITTVPNDYRGNTLIYGHNTPKVLGNTKHIVTGDVARITATNGRVFTYRYVGDELVKPDNTSNLSLNPEKPLLTVMTCNGLFSENRRLLFFELLEVS